MFSISYRLQRHDPGGAAASASKCLRCLPDSYCRGGSLVDANSLTPFFYFFPFGSDFLRRRRRRRALAASHRYRIRTRVVGIFVADLQRFDSCADAQTPDVADQEVDVIALHWPLVTLETHGHHQRYPGPSTALHGPAGSVRTSCMYVSSDIIHILNILAEIGYYCCERAKVVSSPNWLLKTE